MKHRFLPTLVFLLALDLVWGIDLEVHYTRESKVTKNHLGQTHKDP